MDFGLYMLLLEYVDILLFVSLPMYHTMSFLSQVCLKKILHALRLYMKYIKVITLFFDQS